MASNSTNFSSRNYLKSTQTGRASNNTSRVKMAFSYDFQACTSMCQQMLWQLQTMQYTQQHHYPQHHLSHQQLDLHQQPEYYWGQQKALPGANQDISPRLGEGGHPLDQPLSLDVNIEYTLDKKKFIDLESTEPALMIDPSFWKQGLSTPADSTSSLCSPATSNSSCSSPYTPTVKSHIKHHHRQSCQYSASVDIVDLLGMFNC